MYIFRGDHKLCLSFEDHQSFKTVIYAANIYFLYIYMISKGDNKENQAYHFPAL